MFYVRPDSPVSAPCGWFACPIPPQSCWLRAHSLLLLVMLVRDKLCFVLSSSWRPAGRFSAPRIATTTIAATTPTFSTHTGTTMSSSSALGTWPNPQAFNALPLSARTKAYCDYGDEGKMAWKPHEEPPKVTSCDLASPNLASFRRLPSSGTSAGTAVLIVGS